jgi:serine phosphatase RsbU (regulator of sigma subunit)/HAMP domain-containing protein
VRFSLRKKLILLTTLIVAVIMATVTYFVTIRENTAREAALSSEMARLATGIATMQLLDRLDWNVYQSYISNLLSVNPDIVYIAIYDHRNDLRAHALNKNLIQGVDKEAPLPSWQEAEYVRQLDRGAVDERSRSDLQTNTVAIRRGNRVLGSVHVGFWLQEIRAAHQLGLQRNLYLGGAFLVISVILALVFSRRVTGPLEHLSGAMAGVATGNLEQKVSVVSRDEIGELAGTFNEMVEGLRERRIIDSLGRELGATFQLERLSRLVRQRLSVAIGSGARLLLRFGDARGVLREYPTPDPASGPAAVVELDAASQAFLGRAGEGFLFEEGPAELGRRLATIGVGPGELLVPMVVKARLLGMLAFNRPVGTDSFTAKRRQFAAMLARQAAPALENAMLYDELADQARLKSELEIARSVQRRLLPLTMPSVNGFSLDGVCLPATEVGGDYYDFFRLTETRLGVVIADVSGKGTSAAFYMAEIKGMMQPLVRVHDSPSRVLVELNRGLYDSLDRRVFASMLYGVCDFPNGRFTFARAGHNALLRVAHDGECDFITPGGIALGLDPGEVFESTLEQHELCMRSGDALVLYTDGLTDAMNRELEPFGEQRLMAASQAAMARRGAVGMREGVLEAVEGFVQGSEQFDDLTMVIMRCDAKQGPDAQVPA